MHDKPAKGILSASNGMNLYRGCTHGCIYCDSRSSCYQMEHLFEDVEVKSNAPQLLEQALRRKRRACMITTGSMSDPYLPLERQLGLMRQCLEIIERYGFGISLLTKSDLVLRDIDLLERIHRKGKAVVCMSVTTWDEPLCRRLEPAVATTKERFRALWALAQRGIPTGVWLCPLLPFINDTPENLQGILDFCFDLGVKVIVNFGMGVTLRQGSREYFYQQLDRLFPGMKERYIRTFGESYDCSSPRAPQLEAMFRRQCREHGVLYRPEECFSYLTAWEPKGEGRQMSLFEPGG